ncbi:MAG TPA: hypothetical protein PLC53_00935 [Bacilli bacterium]|nr:hypothetical protein [Bacilli bacterium]
MAIDEYKNVKTALSMVYGGRISEEAIKIFFRMLESVDMNIAKNAFYSFWNHDASSVFDKDSYVYDAKAGGNGIIIVKILEQEAGNTLVGELEADDEKTLNMFLNDGTKSGNNEPISAKICYRTSKKEVYCLSMIFGGIDSKMSELTIEEYTKERMAEYYQGQVVEGDTEVSQRSLLDDVIAGGVIPSKTRTYHRDNTDRGIISLENIANEEVVSKLLKKKKFGRCK